jgi:transaldolase
MVKIFADTANMDEIRTFLEWGMCDGVTTNQKIFLAEGGVDFKRRILDICSLVNGPVSVETTSNNPKDLLAEGREYASWHPNIVVKVAMYGNGDGLAVVSRLSEEGIETNMTCMVNFSQLFLACKAGARYVSLFFNRARDAGEDPVSAIRNISTVIKRDDLKSEVIVGSMRKTTDIEEAAVAGAHIITIPHKVFVQLPLHSKTEETIREFDEAWKKFKGIQTVRP